MTNLYTRCISRRRKEQIHAKATTVEKFLFLDIVHLHDRPLGGKNSAYFRAIFKPIGWNNGADYRIFLTIAQTDISMLRVLPQTSRTASEKGSARFDVVHMSSRPAARRRPPSPQSSFRSRLSSISRSVRQLSKV